MYTCHFPISNFLQTFHLPLNPTLNFCVICSIASVCLYSLHLFKYLVSPLQCLVKRACQMHNDFGNWWKLFTERAQWLTPLDTALNLEISVEAMKCLLPSTSICCITKPSAADSNFSFLQIRSLFFTTCSLSFVDIYSTAKFLLSITHVLAPLTHFLFSV